MNLLNIKNDISDTRKYKKKISSSSIVTIESVSIGCHLYVNKIYGSLQISVMATSLDGSIIRGGRDVFTGTSIIGGLS